MPAQQLYCGTGHAAALDTRYQLPAGRSLLGHLGSPSAVVLHVDYVSPWLSPPADNKTHAVTCQHDSLQQGLAAGVLAASLGRCTCPQD
jgi:hypothetical protein